MTTRRFEEEVRQCNLHGITVLPLCTPADEHNCGLYGYSVYYVARLRTGHEYVVVKPDEWPRISFGIVAEDGASINYLMPNDDVLTDQGTPRTDRLAIQLLQRTRVPHNRPVRRSTVALDHMVQACVNACTTEAMTIDVVRSQHGRDLLLVRWTPVNVGFCRIQLVLAPTDWHDVGVGVLSPMPRIDTDVCGNSFMNNDSISIQYHPGDLATVLRNNVDDDRLSSFSE